MTPPADDRLRIVHVVCSGAFAGVERYLFYTAPALVRLGHRVTVIGGAPEQMAPGLAAAGVTHLPAARPWTATRALLQTARGADLVHAHMTEADLVAVATKPRLRRPVASTIHFTRPRGSTGLRRRLWSHLPRFMDAQIAVSEHVARASGLDCVVVPPGIPDPGPGSGEERQPVVLVAQRFEPEKRTIRALDVWAQSGLAEHGWTLQLAGRGAEERALRAAVGRRDLAGVEFLGFVGDLEARMRTAGVFLAPSPIDGFGLSVVEAMAAALPVVAARGAGHIETMGPVAEDCLFDVEDPAAGATTLRALASDAARRHDIGNRLRARYEAEYTIERHALRLEEVYRTMARRDPAP